MDILKQPNATRSLGKPANWNDETMGVCETLDIVDIEDAHACWQVSHWKPSAKELAELNANGVIELWVSGPTHPVVSVAVKGIRD